jgi:osmoprotectant transport system ATP-binding protein
VIKFVNVTKIYPRTAVPAVSGLSFNVPEGETCVLIGPSGSGKTTSLKMINRLIEPSSGEIYMAGDNVLQQDPVKLRRGMGYVIQQIGLFPHMTIGDNIAVVPRLLGWDKARINQRIDELIDMVGMDPADYRDRYPRELSGGQRQRIGVARALAADPPVMLMDEPFGAIDPITRDRLQNEFLRLQKRLRKTIMFVTHDIDEAIKMGTLICVLRVGGIMAQFDTPANILTNPVDDFVADFVGADRGLKRLGLIRVGEAMDTNLALARTDDSATAVADQMRQKALDSMLVVDDRNRLAGYVTLKAVKANAGKTVGAIVHEVVATTEEEATMKDAFSEMLSLGVGNMPVLDEKEKVVGLVTVADAQRLISEGVAHTAGVENV